MALTKHNAADSRRIARVTPATPIPIDTSTNASYALTYTGDNLTTIVITIEGVAYTRTLAYTGSVLDSVTAWSAV